MVIHKCDMCGKEITSKIFVHMYIVHDGPLDGEYEVCKRYQGDRELCKECFVRNYRIPAFEFDRGYSNMDPLDDPPF